MIFFFSGRPSTLLMYQTILRLVSLASEPERPKKTRLMPWGARSTIILASRIEGSEPWPT